ncbi:Uncharacterised protein [Vibrio cholerae]|nr:Uncharacterised protein [Vibrio cholerae]
MHTHRALHHRGTVVESTGLVPTGLACVQCPRAVLLLHTL